jgi:ribonuclease-3
MYTNKMEFEHGIGYRFTRDDSPVGLFLEATEGSHIKRRQLAFLGDAVVKLAVNDYLVKRADHLSPDQVFMLKDWLCSNEKLAAYAMKLGLCEGEGSNRNVIHKRATWFEALVAVIYLDGGDETARRFVQAQIDGRDLDNIPDKYRAHRGHHRMYRLPDPQNSRKVG